MLLRFFNACVFISIAAMAQSQSLVANYAFNNNADDMSGNNLHGSINGAIPVTDRSGNSNAAYYFGSNAYIEVPNDPMMKPDFPFSISLWMKKDLATLQTSTFLYASDATPLKYSGFWIAFLPDGRISAAYGDGDSPGPSNRVSRHSSETINDLSWHNIVAVFNGPNDIDLFIDCRFQTGPYSGSGSGMFDYGNAGAIGAKGNTQSYAFYGSIDDVHVYDVALSQQERDSLCKVAGSGEDPTVNLHESPENDEFLLYPNPTNQTLNVALNQEKFQGQLTIFDQQGRQMMTSDRSAINVSHLSPGLYRVYGLSEDHYMSATFIKE